MKKTSPLVRILFSVALLAVVIYIYQQRKASGSGAASRQPFPAESPSAEGGGRFQWIPSYPGASISGIHSRLARGEMNYGFEFQSAADPQQVISFYEAGLHAEGFTAQTKAKASVEIDLHAESPDRKRRIDVVAEQTADQPGSAVTVAAVQK